MMHRLASHVVWFAAILAVNFAAAQSENDSSISSSDLFESRIRPALVEHCYECHNSINRAEGELVVDFRDGLLKGGSNGPIIVPGKPAESRLLPILRHEVEGMKMPEGGVQFSSAMIADFEKWIAQGAVDPRNQPPTEQELSKELSWETVLEKRRAWWSFQPIKLLRLDESVESARLTNPIDRLIEAKLREQNLLMNGRADSQTLIRRAYFTIIGIPPSIDDVKQWTEKLKDPSGFEALVDHLLSSPHYGEKWARHWMDWIRYADSHGSEGDPSIDNSWLYRDYLIRALNDDVPYDQMLKEHVAGDLLDFPRINDQLKINESAIGTSHWRMVFHGFSPTDALDEKVRFTDDAIAAFSKAFLGLTVSCARCHDHKFDPISQRDYYALFGVLASCKPGRTVIDLPSEQRKNYDELRLLKGQIKDALIEEWSTKASAYSFSTESSLPGSMDLSKVPNAMRLWHSLQIQMSKNASFADAWKQEMAKWNDDKKRRSEHETRNYSQRWRFTDEKDASNWYRVGLGLEGGNAKAGDFGISVQGESVVKGIYPSGVYTNRVSAKHAARLSSPKFNLDGEYVLWLRVVGENGSSARYVIQDYPRNGTVFPVVALQNQLKWQKLDMTYWNGDEAHIELATGKDAPLLVNNEDRSWFGIHEALLVKKGDPEPPVDSLEYLDPIFEAAILSPPESIQDLTSLFQQALAGSMKAWKDGTISDAQSLFLNECLVAGILSNQANQLPSAESLIQRYRQLEEQIVVPTRVPSLEETVGRDQPLFARGNHKQPQERVPRRFLEAIDSTPYKTLQSGRLQLADDLIRSDNPLTRRVIVNRLWHHAFGRGLVATPDNFGRLGAVPTHPELLDYLASQFSENKWSLKKTIRQLICSKVWQTSSHASREALASDPDNQWLSHAFVRRIEAEAIRDSLLAVTGSLDRSLYGNPTAGNSNRRSLYVRVQRNALDPFLRSFDFPEPFSTMGRRDATNVPAQSLTLMNDLRVIELASRWAKEIASSSTNNSDEAKIRRMIIVAFGREPKDVEIEQWKSYLSDSKVRYENLANQTRKTKSQIAKNDDDISKILEPVRAQLMSKLELPTNRAPVENLPTPISQWDFENDMNDSIGKLHGKAFANAKIEGGALHVRSGGYVVTEPIPISLKAKTIEAWVQLDSLEQRGGGVFSIQTPDGAVFDSIVFGEQYSGQWQSGSNGFQRTRPLSAPLEKDAQSRPVHVAIVYDEKGLITAYRDGVRYGTEYQSDGPIEYVKNKAVISFGVRHLPATGNRMLDGRIYQARLYDRALTAKELEVSAASFNTTVSDAQVINALEPEAKNRFELLVAENKKLAAGLDAVSLQQDVNANSEWEDLAHSIFTLQEFIYLK